MENYGAKSKANSAGTEFITLSLAFYQFFVRSLSSAVVDCNGIFCDKWERCWFLLLVFILSGFFGKIIVDFRS